MGMVDELRKKVMIFFIYFLFILENIGPFENLTNLTIICRAGDWINRHRGKGREDQPP
jgi:hypothetical protein